MRTNMMLSPYCLIVLGIIVRGYSCTYVQAKFEHGPLFDGMTCSATELILNTSNIETGLLSCVAECVNMGSCMCVFYHTVSGWCHGCSRRYSSVTFGMLEDLTGSLHYLKQGCPAGWMEWRHSCYKTTDMYVTFMEGAAECDSNQGHAVYIDDAEEYDFLMANFHDQALEFLYVGVYYNTSLSVWMNYGTNQPIVYNNWENVLNPDEHCAALYQHVSVGWVNCYCNLTSPTLCEIDI